MKIRVVVLTILALALWTGVASAGALTVRDSAGYVPQGDVATLSSEAGSWPFDVHLLVENAPSFAALENDAHVWVDSNSMVIGIDPVHHKTVTRFGVSTGVKVGDFDSISAAGNANFRSKEIRQGIEAIVLRAKASRESTSTAMSASTTPVVIKEGLGFFPWLFIILGFAALVMFIVAVVRKSRRDRASFENALDANRLETSELISKNVDRMTTSEELYEKPVRAPTTRAPLPASSPYIPPAPAAYVPTRAYVPAPAPVYVQPVPVYQPAPVIINQGNNGSSFTEGLLVGELLSSPRRERDVIVEREVIREEPVYQSRRSSRNDDDAGGGGSSWDSGGSSGSSSWDSGSSSTSNDSGGSSSSWDSGSSSNDSGGSSSSYDSGSSDSGGGGSDSGGGSSDW